MRTAIIFDFDGTILDTETPEFTAWQEVYAAHGVELDRAVYSQVIGTTDAHWDPAAALAGSLGRLSGRDEFRADQQDRFDQLITAETTRPGVREWLDEARDLGLRVGLASSSSYRWVSRFLDQLGLRDRFTAIATADRVARTKPDPALYRLALADLGVEPADALAVEDSPNGIAAAKAAGLFCVAVPNPMTAGASLAAADLQLGSLDDISLEQVLRRHP